MVVKVYTSIGQMVAKRPSAEFECEDYDMTDHRLYLKMEGRMVSIDIKDKVVEVEDESV